MDSVGVRNISDEHRQTRLHYRMIKFVQVKRHKAYKMTFIYFFSCETISIDGLLNCLTQRKSRGNAADGADAHPR